MDNSRCWRQETSTRFSTRPIHPQHQVQYQQPIQHQHPVYPHPDLSSVIHQLQAEQVIREDRAKLGKALKSLISDAGTGGLMIGGHCYRDASGRLDIVAAINYELARHKALEDRAKLGEALKSLIDSSTDVQHVGQVVPLPAPVPVHSYLHFD